MQSAWGCLMSQKGCCCREGAPDPRARCRSTGQQVPGAVLRAARHLLGRATKGCRTQPNTLEDERAAGRCYRPELRNTSARPFSRNSRAPREAAHLRYLALLWQRVLVSTACAKWRPAALTITNKDSNSRLGSKRDFARFAFTSKKKICIFVAISLKCFFFSFCA